MIIFIKDNFITKQDCDWAIKTYKKIKTKQNILEMCIL